MRAVAAGDRIVLLVALFVAIVICTVVVADVRTSILNAVRGYVSGEGLWSKAQKAAVYHLTRYADSHDERDFDFARAYTDPGTPLQVSQLRLARSRELLSAATPSVESAKNILRDHYEGTFLGGPYFNAGVPDFLTLCMHSHPAGFTWGNTASSTVFVLPGGEDPLPYVWWTPCTPCTGVYLPVFVDAGTVPEAFAASDTAQCRPEDAPEPAYDPRSYWWRFRRLLDTVKGGEMAWDFADRQPLVRRAFDPLERRWAEELPAVRSRAREDRQDRAAILAEFTARCAREALEVLDDLMEGFAGDGRPT